MAWLCKDKDGTESVFKRKPNRWDKRGTWSEFPYIQLPKGSIRKLIGREVTWEDEPVELK